MRYLLFALLLVLSSSAEADCLWPEDCGSGSGGSDASYANLFMRNNSSTVEAHTTNWEPLLADSHIAQMSADNCFTEPSDGVIKNVCATAIVQGSYSAQFYAAGTNGLTNGTEVKWRFAISADDTCASYGFVNGNYEVMYSYITNDLVDPDDDDVPQTPLDFFTLGAMVAMPSMVFSLPKDYCVRVEIDPSSASLGVSDSIIVEGLHTTIVKLGGPSGVDGVDGNFATDGPTNVAVLTGKDLILNETITSTITEAELAGGVITNYGAAGATTHTLGTETCVQGRNFSVAHGALFAMTLEPFGSDRFLHITDTNGDFIVSDGTAACALACECIATGIWLCPGSACWTEE